ncbi:MAG: hypothetical protein E7287_05970 [Lachnospiraceae bacterium]|nr:hypothetical protein [Lachnospiraceae bacterium]
MRHSKSTLFLMELIIAILFFALASTVCIRLFAKSHLLSKQTVDQNEMIIQVQNMADIFLAAEGHTDKMAELLSLADYNEEGASFLQYFDENWNTVQDIRDTSHSILLKLLPEENGLLTAKIDVYSIKPTVKEDGELYAVMTKNIYNLTVNHHIAERRGSLEK